MALLQPIGGGMFGRNLSETVTYEARKTGGYIPVFVERCVEFIRERGLAEEGLFRLPGDQKQVIILRDAFNKGMYNVKCSIHKNVFYYVFLVFLLNIISVYTSFPLICKYFILLIG